MKEQTLVEMKNKVDALVGVMKNVVAQIDNLRDLSVGTLEITKNMSEYPAAVEKLKNDVLNAPKEKKLEIGTSI